MRRFRIALFLIFASNSAWASFQSSDKGTTAANFLKLGIGARAIAMGEAYTAVADDANALYWNPAALTRIEKHSVALNHAAYLDSSFYDYAAYGQKYRDNAAFCVAFNYLSTGKITETDINGKENGQFAPHDVAAVVGYAQRLHSVSIGVSVKYVQSQIVDSASTYAIDGGVLSDPIKSKLRLGASFSNLGGPLKYDSTSEKLPLLLRFGSSYQLLPAWLASADVLIAKDNQPTFAAGTEYKFVTGENFGLTGRAGYNTKTQNDVPGFAGASFGLGMDFQRLRFDYAFLPFGSLGLTHHLSFNFKF